LAGAHHQTPLRELKAFPTSPNWILGVLLLRKGRGGKQRRTGREERVKGGKKGKGQKEEEKGRAKGNEAPN